MTFILNPHAMSIRSFLRLVVPVSIMFFSCCGNDVNRSSGTIGTDVVVWDNKKNKKSEEMVIYKAPYRKMLMEYDFILIDRVK